MRVDSNANINLSATRVEPNRLTEVAPTTPATSSSAAIDSDYTQAPDLLRLVQALRETPDVRADVVADAVSELAKGEFTTTQSALETAQTILELQTLKAS